MITIDREGVGLVHLIVRDQNCASFVLSERVKVVAVVVGEASAQKPVQ